MYTLLTLIYFSCFVTIPLQWGYTSSGQKDWEVVYPVSFSDHGIPIVSKVGSSATSTDVGIIGEKEKLYVHISEMITTLQGIYWIAIGK